MNFTKFLINIANCMLTIIKKKSKDWYCIVIANHYLKLEYDKEYQKDYRSNVLNPIMFKLLNQYKKYSGMLGIKTIVKVDNVIVFHLSRPGILIGMGGKDIDELTKELSEWFNEEIEIKIYEDKFSTQPMNYDLEDW